MNDSIFSYLNTSKGATTIAIVAIVIATIILITKKLEINIFILLKKISAMLLFKSSSYINSREKAYERDLEIGRINNKSRRVKSYKFLNELIIDLGLKRMGATPYEFLFICTVGALVIAILLCQIVFNGLWMIILIFPITLAAIICILYTKANVAHDARIENIIEAENIVCNNIKGGVVKAVRDSINVIPRDIRTEFEDFLDNVEHKNYHIKTALLALNNQLGSVSDDFIKKSIVFEMEEEHGIVGMFQDLVEINNSKMQLRTEMKRNFEEIVTNFIVGATMIFVFLGGVLALYKDVAQFYFKNPIGQLLLSIDALILIGEFVYITYLRAQEL